MARSPLSTRTEKAARTAPATAPLRPSANRGSVTMSLTIQRPLLGHRASATLCADTNRADPGNVSLGQVIDDIRPQCCPVHQEKCGAMSAGELAGQPHHSCKVSLRH